MDPDVDTLFKKFLPLEAEKYSLKEFQKNVVVNVIAGNNTLCIMPTGGGKSLIYWLSGLTLQGITLVISPLIALIDEQSEKIREQGIEVLTIHSGIAADKQIQMLKKFANGSANPKFIFASPERISTDGFFEHCLSKRKTEIKLVAIDEVHCVSQWGNSFRPFYKRIPVFLNEVYGIGSWGPKVLALTATLNPKEVEDICQEFNIGNENLIRDDLLMRSEINIKVIKLDDEDKKEDKLWDLLNIHQGEKALVYLYRKYKHRGVEDLTEIAVSKGFKATSFHGDMTAADRQSIIKVFKNNEIDVVFATNAFGMGIDIPDIRVVIHFMIPESVEQYYQEIGRAARNIASANAYILYTTKNIKVKKDHYIDNSFPKTEELESCYSKITGDKVGIATLQYYEDEVIQKCLPYFLDSGLISILCKGIFNLKILSNIINIELQDIYNATKEKGLLASMKKTGLSAEYIVNLIYKAFLDNEVGLKHFDKCLIINSSASDISDDKMKEITSYIDERKDYKHKLLDYFVYLLEEYSSSIELHQEMGRYLGVPKHLLNKIYSTHKGDKVRSKSEVIIANTLHANKVKYEYEKKLYYNKDSWIEPDFTITMPDGTEVYWEHLGMIGSEEYDKTWLRKLDIYRKCFSGKLEKTYEGTTISDSALNMLKKLKLI